MLARSALLTALAALIGAALPAIAGAADPFTFGDQPAQVATVG